MHNIIIDYADIQGWSSVLCAAEGFRVDPCVVLDNVCEPQLIILGEECITAVTYRIHLVISYSVCSDDVFSTS